MPELEYSRKYNVSDVGIPLQEALNFENAKFCRAVSVDYIISVEGPRTCLE